MDFSLQSLRDAFTDAAYKRSRRGYKLYAVLLATTLDQRFLAEYLSLFHELHALTGTDVLVMGLGTVNVGHGDTPVWLREMRSVAATLQHGDGRARGTDAAERFLDFMQAQTAESYELARFLGIRTDAFPVMVFFEDLEHPDRMVIWPLGDIRGAQFAKQLRHLLEEVRERCAWREARNLRNLEKTVRELGDAELTEYHSSLPHDCREAAKTLNQLRNEVREYERALRVREQVSELRAGFAELCAMRDLHVPVKSIGETIADLENGGFGHVNAHERRWRSRLPPRYRSAVAALRGASFTIGLSTKPLPSQEEIASAIRTRTAELAEIEAEHQAHRLEELARRTKELEQAQERVRSAPAVLSMIEDVLRIRSCPFDRGSPSEAFYQGDVRSVPRVFLSYSHDSPAHSADVLALAQRLRDDGIDCWIDQFESSPAAGFPRWMLEQVKRADFVLLVCTATYRRRFDGAEEAGKGLGVTYEGLLITQEVYDAGSQNTRFIPVLMPGGSSQDVPVLLRGSKWYEVPQGYDVLRRRLTGSEGVEPHPLGRPSRRDCI